MNWRNTVLGSAVVFGALYLAVAIWLVITFETKPSQQRAATVVYNVQSPAPAAPHFGWTYDGVRDQIRRAAAEFGVSEGLLLNIARCESGLNPTVTNPYSGAAGLFQFEWPTFNAWVGNLWWQPGTWLSPYNPRVASRLAAWAFSRGYSNAWACSYIVGGLKGPPPLWKNWLHTKSLHGAIATHHHPRNKHRKQPVHHVVRRKHRRATPTPQPTPRRGRSVIPPVLPRTATPMAVPTSPLMNATPTMVKPPAGLPTAPKAAPSTGGSLAVTYTGTDYYYPADYFDGCPNWTWLTSCYLGGGKSVTVRQMLADDVAWIKANHMGSFQRVWIMLDEGIKWSSGSYAGLDGGYLNHLDDALSILHTAGIKVDLVVYEASKGSSDQYQFQTQALDGNHSSLRQGYLQALQDLVKHLAASPTDVATVAVLDLYNEVYWQLEQFGYSDSVIHQWMIDEYNAAHAAVPNFVYTFSDTTRLLKDPKTWINMYPVDAYDIHLYDDTPWSSSIPYASAKTLPKPWFAGETGCASGHISCTYSGGTSCTQPSTCALSVDGWFLNNMRNYGAAAVLIEERNTSWGYQSGPTSQAPTLVGNLIQHINGLYGVPHNLNKGHRIDCPGLLRSGACPLGLTRKKH